MSVWRVGSVSTMSRKTQVKKQFSARSTKAKPTKAKPTKAKPTKAKPTKAKPTSVKPRRKVSFQSGFHFYKTIGNYTGVTATSLSEFATKLKTIPAESVTFHFQRKDFQSWIKYTLKDGILAERISNAKPKQSSEALRKEILGIIQARKTPSF
jgi:hypothetical protein